MPGRSHSLLGQQAWAWHGRAPRRPCGKCGPDRPGTLRNRRSRSADRDHRPSPRTPATERQCRRNRPGPSIAEPLSIGRRDCISLETARFWEVHNWLLKGQKMSEPGFAECRSSAEINGLRRSPGASNACSAASCSGETGMSCDAGYLEKFGRNAIGPLETPGGDRALMRAGISCRRPTPVFRGRAIPRG